MNRSGMRIGVALGGAAAFLALVAGLAGVLFRGDLGTFEFRTVRGEVVQVVSEGVYRYNAEGIVGQGIGWDLVTLLLVVPVSLVGLRLLWRGSLRAAMVMSGLLAYLAYRYFQYAVIWAYGPLYPVPVATFALALSALAVLVASLDLGSLPARVGAGFPRRPVVGYGALIMFVLSGMWLPVILSTLGGETPELLQGSTTLVVQAFDLGLLVPLGVFTAVCVHRRAPVGYLLAAVALVKGASMALAIAAMLLVRWQVTGELELPPLVMFTLVALLSLFLAWRALWSVSGPPWGASGRIGSLARRSWPSSWRRPVSPWRGSRREGRSPRPTRSCGWDSRWSRVSSGVL